MQGTGFLDSEMYETDSESDEETELQELKQLTAVIEATKPGSVPTSHGCLSHRDLSKAHEEKVLKAISLNKLTDEKFCKLESTLIYRLKECRQRLADIRDSQSVACKQRPEKQNNTFRYLICGRPYFKDRDNFPAPDNEDTITMERAGMYDFSEVQSVPGWTVNDKDQLLEKIAKMSRTIKKDKINSEIAQLRRETKVNDSKQINKQIAALNTQLKAVDKMPLSTDLALPIDQEYDWDALAVAMNRRHSAQELRALWKLFLHPSINKKSWERHEHSKLQELAHLNRVQDWDKIAIQLNTGRTAYQCFVYFRTNMGSSLSGQKWTREEEEYLRRLIDYFREEDYIPWGKVAASMENRTKIQIYNKYARLMEQRKGRFLPEEDAVILTCVEHFGQNFKRIVKYLPGRSAAQLRTRHNVLSTPTKVSTVWTIDEDKKLVQMMANQDSSFINYAGLTEFFPQKTRAQLRARYSTLVKWMKKHPNRDISKAPRRGARRLGHGQCSGDLDKAIENLKTRIKSEVENKKSRKITRNSPDDVLDHAIIATLVTENAKEEERRRWLDVDPTYQDPMSNTKIDDKNLRKLLIFLRTSLMKDKFQSSVYAREYPSLLEAETLSYDVNPKLIRSYSKKTSIPNIMVVPTSPLDVWGENSLAGSEYVLPPNYATITGCKKLMSYIATHPAPDQRTISMHCTIKRNRTFRDQMELFMDRFNCLFMWPILLSNVGPVTYENTLAPLPYIVSMEEQAKFKKNREKLSMTEGEAQGIVIPHLDEGLQSLDEHFDNNQIDLDVSMQDVSTLRTHVGNDDFLYLDATK